MLMRLFRSAAVASFRSALALGGLLMLRIVLSMLSLISGSGTEDGSFAVPITPAEIKIAVGIAVAVFFYSWWRVWRRLGEEPDLPIS